MVLGLGTLAILVLVVGLRVLAAWRVTRATANARFTRRTPIAVRMLDRATLPPTADAGMRFALDPGRGAASVPVWTSVLGVTLTIALLAGLWSFQSSLRHLLDTPHLYGWNWSVKSGAPALPDLAGSLDPRVRTGPDDLGAGVGHGHPGRARAASVSTCSGSNRTRVRRSHRRCWTVVCPKRTNEMMLGTSTLEKAGLHIGDIAVLRLGNTATGLRVVGRGVFPEFGDTGRLGNGVFLTYAGLQKLLPQAQQNVFFVRFRDGIDVASQRPPSAARARSRYRRATPDGRASSRSSRTSPGFRRCSARSSRSWPPRPSRTRC